MNDYFIHAYLNVTFLVHQLTPADIGIVAAAGDSITVRIHHSDLT